MSPGAESKTPAIAVPIVIGLVATALVIYGNTAAFAWDEGYHLVAAFLIAHGKQPYIDFVFPQTPFNAYWNAFLLRIFGESWRVPHTAAALLTSGAVALTTLHVYRRLPLSKSWRAAAAIVVAVIFGLNHAVVDFGSLQAYGMCLIMVVSAYLATVSSVEHPGVLRPALAGLCCGIAAGSSLLTAIVAPVLLVWMLIVSQPGSRVKKCIAFCIAIIPGFIPLLRLLIKAPDPVIFGFLQYQLLFRKVEWEDAGLHNLGEVLSWADSSQAVLLVLLAAAGIVFAHRSELSRSLKNELYLCGVLAIAQGGYLLTARPTFARYYLLTVPYLAIAAAYGLYEVATRLTTDSRPRPWLAATILCVLTVYGIAGAVFEERDDMMWKDIEETAAKVREVTPPNASLLADEAVYFALHRTPPSGMELEDSHKLTFSDARAKALHILPRRKLDLMIKAGAFDTVEMCDDDEIARIGLASLYQKTVSAGSCKVFWQWGKTEPE